MAKDSDTSRRGPIEAARARTASAYEAARNRASDATRKANEQLAIYPLSAVVGGFPLAPWSVRCCYALNAKHG